MDRGPKQILGLLLSIDNVDFQFGMWEHLEFTIKKGQSSPF